MITFETAGGPCSSSQEKRFSNRSKQLKRDPQGDVGVSKENWARHSRQREQERLQCGKILCVWWNHKESDVESL